MVRIDLIGIVVIVGVNDDGSDDGVGSNGDYFSII